ncbi:DUF423 domain-containing protein [Pelovirga terrestris]|uniref:DUF423 domain-containing protein n=1 Tax=Pelovirga terrestris TaxID=2771352 RepID=A0A8J6QLY0_9BACT|nr:DUF423 domain-containing protein [Pelovirga terrestris]MBD1399652.1 DUF423 domain-containing protein [Pelovirga terrestris]
MKLFVVMGSLNAFLAVAFGAFGAHGLKSKVSPDMLAAWQTSVQYHMFHALGLILLGVLIHLFPQTGLLRASGWLLFSGIVLFSGSLYVMVVSGVRALGMVTPIGGMTFLMGWLLLAFCLFRNP